MAPRLSLLLALPCAAHGAATIPGAAAQAKIVEVHNTYRCGMCDTPPLVWDAAIAKNAKDYMDTGAASGHCPSSTGAVAGCVGNGENMYSGTAGDDAFVWEMAVNMWFAGEIDCYNFDTGGKTCTAGHMTQVAWDASTKIGCASNDAATGGMKSLCMYSAAGNFNGEANYPNHVHKCPEARQYTYYTGRSSCCNGPKDVCKNGMCGWEYAQATTTKGCPKGSCSAHASCPAASTGPAAAPTPTPAASPTPTPAANPSPAPTSATTAAPTSAPVGNASAALGLRPALPAALLLLLAAVARA